MACTTKNGLCITIASSRQTGCGELLCMLVSNTCAVLMCEYYMHTLILPTSDALVNVNLFVAFTSCFTCFLNVSRMMAHGCLHCYHIYIYGYLILNITCRCGTQTESQS